MPDPVLEDAVADLQVRLMYQEDEIKHLCYELCARLEWNGSHTPPVSLTRIPRVTAHRT